MEKRHEDTAGSVSYKRKFEGSEEHQFLLKKSKFEEPDKSISFEDKFKEFVKSNEVFFESVKHENSVLLVKNSPARSFGNYTNYYGLRGLKRWEDPRINLIKSEWVQNKKCLDIGCNEGIFTILLAVKYCPKIIIGCDIDYTLINKAIAHLRSLEKNKTLMEEIKKSSNPESAISEKRKELIRRLEKIPKSFTIGLSLPKELMMEETKHEEINMNENTDILERLIFRQENYISDMDSNENFDTIFCLSTAKWIHLHYGDAGLKALFYKVYKSLSSGGIFVFEPQPWKSYKKKKHLAPILKEQIKKINFLPNEFLEYLTNIIGFKLLEKALPEAPTKKGYDRPIFVLQK